MKWLMIFIFCIAYSKYICNFNEKLVLILEFILGNALKCWRCPSEGGESHLCQDIHDNGDLVEVDGDKNYCSLRIATYLDGSIVYIDRDFEAYEDHEGIEIRCRYQGEYYVSFFLCS